MPTVTYTPSDTQRTSCQIQEAGDVAQAAVIQQGGEYALDMIKFLTGPPMNGIRKVDRFSTLTLLRNLVDMRDNDMVFLESTGSCYWYDIASTATHDGYSVISPFSGTGRWFRVGGVPQTTSQSIVYMGTEMVVGVDVPVDTVNGSWEQGGSITTGICHDLDGILPGDVLTGLACNIEKNSSPSPLTLYLVAQQAGSPGTTTTILSTQTVSATGTATYSFSHTVAAGERIRLIVQPGGSTGSWTWYSHTLSYTRSYITT